VFSHSIKCITKKIAVCTLIKATLLHIIWVRCILQCFSISNKIQTKFKEELQAGPFHIVGHFPWWSYTLRCRIILTRYMSIIYLSIITILFPWIHDIDIMAIGYIRRFHKLQYYLKGCKSSIFNLNLNLTFYPNSDHWSRVAESIFYITGIAVSVSFIMVGHFCV